MLLLLLLLNAFHRISTYGFRRALTVTQCDIHLMSTFRPFKGPLSNLYDDLGPLSGLWPKGSASYVTAELGERRNTPWKKANGHIDASYGVVKRRGKACS